MESQDFSMQYDWEILCKNKVLCIAGWWFTFWAGILNAFSTYSVIFMRTTHMSGRVTDQAKNLLTNPAMALFITVVLASFVTGSYYGTKALPRLGMTYSLLVPVLPLLLTAVLVYFGFTAAGKYSMEPWRFLLGMMMPFAAGWQNSITSQGRIGRTTHFTGDLTDLGILLASGNRERASYIAIKYSGFVAGGMIGYLGGQSVPALTLVGLAGGYTATVVVLHLKNALAAQPAVSRATQWKNTGKEEAVYGKGNS
ncbi:MAG: DUF1275 family protein [Bacillota bacterium]|nr:DUF1275 family protein [Bacillota bacterium]MDW7684265.1 DUF1275 family protein [Bacillota bacterium]